ncbi:MAG: hypothetical protein U5M53_08210 [Rhodoferax sp.]|nr:hypothetical protein [Rhodoferax sp.]
MAPPNSWDEFEDIVCSAAKNRWRNANFTRHGRQGQRQDGVDVYGDDDQGRLVGLQCKNTLSGLSREVVLDEVGKAESFKPALAHLYVVTTGSTDKALQEFARQLSETREQGSKFKVSVLFWSDVWQDLTLYEARLFQHYPQLRPAAAANGPTHDQCLYEELKTLLAFDPAIRLFRDHDFGGSFSRAAIRPLNDFYWAWESPEKEFKDTELQEGLANLYAAAGRLADALALRTVPVGNGDYSSVFSDNQRAQGPRSPEVIEDARVLNDQARQFVPVYEKFMRRCREKLVR